MRCGVRKKAGLTTVSKKNYRYITGTENLEAISETYY